MGHSISGLIARPEVLQCFADTHRLEQPGPLAAGLGFLPLDDDNLDGIAGLDFAAPAEAGFRYLVPSLRDLLTAFSAGGDLIYVETEYFGGCGGQGAVLLRTGTVAYGPRASNDSALFPGCGTARFRIRSTAPWSPSASGSTRWSALFPGCGTAAARSGGRWRGCACRICPLTSSIWCGCRAFAATTRFVGPVAATHRPRVEMGSEPARLAINLLRCVDARSTCGQGIGAWADDLWLPLAVSSSADQVRWSPISFW